MSSGIKKSWWNYNQSARSSNAGLHEDRSSTQQYINLQYLSRSNNPVSNAIYQSHYICSQQKGLPPFIGWTQTAPRTAFSSRRQFLHAGTLHADNLGILQCSLQSSSSIQHSIESPCSRQSPGTRQSPSRCGKKLGFMHFQHKCIHHQDFTSSAAFTQAVSNGLHASL